MVICEESSQHSLQDLPAVPAFPLLVEPTSVDKEGAQKEGEATTKTRKLRIGACFYEYDVVSRSVDASWGSAETGSLGFLLRKSVIDYAPYWTVEHGAAASERASASGVRPGWLLSAIGEQDCLNSPDAPALMEAAKLPVEVEFLVFKPDWHLVLQGWPFRFGELSVEAKSCASLATTRRDEDALECVIVRADGSARRAGVVAGNVVRAVNGATEPTVREIQEKASRLSPERKETELLLWRTAPLPTVAPKLNASALITRQTGGGVSGRMLAPKIESYV
eukprot:TRINITY_DN17797_c0_g1_i3.p1 TRINITY_DN17797_c0_g1~~TRINITY_DN17797_c0_g1_i3.p1  ORF type:complete len:296 (-),score=55.91 TRINITY_DN17797_c0_g1_i3:372-1208(-)